MPVALGLLVAAAGCGASDPGLGASTGAEGAGSVSSVPVPSTGPTREEAGLDPCALLGARDRSSAGLTSPGEPTTVAGAPACDYVEPGAFGVTVTVDEHTDLEAVKARAPRAEELRVGSAPAVLVADRDADDGTCSVSLAAGRPGVSTVHIDVTTADFQDTAQACARATTVAELIEPEVT
ncbi:Protein of unknown function (DUF3558) [Saccharomonospora cyanea NA-134]|uniref:DUF3558 domain-containing protein n=1 Tax=Saccharomonospora cyanea NA-134 TaxID=882082 RepID=H5XNX2_9PSEU|nr:Protein of unknown function (DUF3558) [Saccharomonospora cyanea NA-134]